MLGSLNVIQNAAFSMFDEIDAIYNRAIEKQQIKNNGLKFLINRPHNLSVVRDEDGKIIGNRLQTVYTPFAKKDIKVEVLNNVLTVICGDEKITEDSNEVYHGISSQSYRFSIPVSKYVDTSKITAKAEDGILTVEFPFKEIKPEDQKQIIDVL